MGHVVSFTLKIIRKWCLKTPPPQVAAYQIQAKKMNCVHSVTILEEQLS